MKNVLVIIGNGFDLDLGLQTRYIDFWNSKKELINNVYWENFGNYDNMLPPIAGAINRYLDSWGDLEDVLKVYASKSTQLSAEPALELFRVSDVINKVNINREYFNIIKQELINYLEEQQTQEIKEGSKAANFLRQLSSSENYLSIFNFNYTDINEYAQQLNINTTFEVNYIHGDLKNKNIILGVGDDLLHQGYDFLYKKWQGAKTSRVEEALLQADEVKIFGVSFGYNDFHYFKEFFQAINEGKLKTDLEIYTKDEHSIESIYQHLGTMGITRRDLLINAHLHWVTTSD